MKKLLISTADKLNNFSFSIAIRRGLIMTIPFMVLGSFAIFINNLPIPAYQSLMLSVFGDNWRSFGGYIHQATFAGMAVIMNLVISNSMITEDNARNNLNAPPLIGAIVALCSFFALTELTNNSLPMDRIGAFGVFVGIVSAIIASKLFVFLHKFKQLQLTVYSNASETHFSQLMKAFFPTIITITAFVIFRITLESVFGIYDIHTTIYDGLRNYFANMPQQSASLVFVTFTHILWFFGIHGSNVLDSVAQNMFVPALYENQALLAYGYTPTNIFTKQFFDVFVYMGGAGTTLSLIFAMLIGTKRSITRQVSKVSLLPGLINVNEMIIFGIPIVFNFYLLIPFVLIPLVLTFTSYLAILSGLVPITIESVEWTTPIIVGGFITTGGSVAGSVLQIFNLALATVLYLPFVALYEKSLSQGSTETLDKLINEAKKNTNLMERQDEIGVMARELAIELQNDFKAKKLYTLYQPQVDSDNKVIGAEVFLRWNHAKLGEISPYAIIALAEEAKIMNELGLWIFTQGAVALSALSGKHEGFIISVNISSTQLDDVNLATEFMKICEAYKIKPEQIELEIMERATISGAKRLDTIKELQTLGFKTALDDFGVGHAPFAYLKELNLTTVKLDGVFVKEITSNPYSETTIKAVIQLEQARNMRVIAENVETKEQRELLKKFGYNFYQGYLFSPAISLDKLVNYTDA